MKSTYKKPTYLLLTTLVVLGFLLPHTTHAGMIADIALLLPGYIVSWIVLPIMSLLVYASGMLLNLSIDMSVVNMADSVKSAGINEIWAVIRDVANMGFIFMLIYTSIMTIFGKGDYQKVIRNTIIAALLINFSLFLTKAVIDASNLVALFFYNAISPGGISTIKGISSSFMDVLGISNLYKGVDAFEGSKLVIIGVGGAVIYLITAFSFLAVAALFIIRFVILMLLMVLSPLMFIGSIIPYLKDKADMWWDALVSQSLFGPIYFMLTWVTLKIAQAMFTVGSGDLSSTGKSAGSSIGAALVGMGKDGKYVADPDAMGVLLKFIIVIAFMITSLLAAKKMAEKVGGGITKTALGWAGGATLGLAGRAGRGTIGRLGSNVAESRTLMDRAAKGGFSGKMARLQLAAGKKAATSSFDARAIKGAEAFGAGKARTGGFAKDLENKVKQNKDFAEKSLKTSDMATYAEEQRLKDLKAGRLSDKEIRKIERQRLADAERLQEERSDLQNERNRAEQHGASKDELDEFDNRLHFMERDINAATSGDHKTYLESRVEKIKGVEEKEAKKRAAAALGKTEGEFATLLKNKDAAAQEALKKEARLSETDVRKTVFARGLETPRTFGRKFDVLSRHLGFGSTKKEYTAAAMDIRKGMKKKSAKDKIAEAAKEIAKEDEDSEGAPTAGGTPPGGTTPTPPSTP
jgi:hypothetical protein